MNSVRSSDQWFAQRGSKSEAARAVGVVGLGVMGHPMAANILRGGSAIHITGRTREKYHDLIEAGAVWHNSPRSLANAVSVMLLMLPDLPEVEEVLGGSDGILAGNFSDLLLIIASTSSPIQVQKLGRRLARETDGRVRVIDAPVSGGSEGAQAGTLSIMVGGDQHDVNDAWTVLVACGNSVHLGPLGPGQVAKACNQLIVAATVLALGEAAALADRSGLALDKLFRLHAGGYAGSRILETRGDRIVREDYTPSGAARYLVERPKLRCDGRSGDRYPDGLASGTKGGIRGAHPSKGTATTTSP